MDPRRLVKLTGAVVHSVRVYWCRKLMRKQDFYGLPRSIQDRFIESSQAIAAPAPLAVLPVADKSAMVWAAAALLAGLGWGGFVALGLGDLHSAFALTLPWHKAVHAAFAGVVTACGLRAYALSWAVRKLPYGSGNYLFSAGVVCARGAALVVHDSNEFKAVAAAGGAVRIQFTDGGLFEFPTGSTEKAGATARAYEKGVEEWKKASESPQLARARLNPLIESGVPNPLAPTNPHERPRLFAPAIFGLIVAVLSVALGLGVSSWRDSLSRKALYKAATSIDTIDAYRAYMARGGEREEVAMLLLPRAELSEAVKVGTVEAIVEFGEKNPNSKIGSEVQNALREGLLRELEKAKSKGTVAAIAELPKRFKLHGLIAAEIAAARRGVYAKALADFQKSVSTVDAGLVPFVSQLLSYAEAKGPVVELRFLHDFPQDPKILDQIVSKSDKYYMGRKSLPVQYFVGDAARAREKVVLQKIQTRLQAAFPKDVLEFRLGAPPTAENAEPPLILVPTITFTHQEKLSGGFVGGKPKAMYLGAALLMTAYAELPGAPKTIEFKWNAWRSPQFSILADKDKDFPDIYEDMMGGAFGEFADIYLGRWFAKP